MKSLLLLFIALPVICNAQITGMEKRLMHRVDQRSAAALDLLKKAVSINSGTMNFAGVRKTGGLFMEELRKLGFDVQWLNGDAFNRAGHLTAIHKGKGKKILLIGHLDTVFDEDSPFREYSMLNDSIMLGPGVCDMKGGDVIMILALQALHDAGLLKDLYIEVVMNGDEESSGMPLDLSKKAVIDAAKRCDYALGYEDGDGLPSTAIIARRGYTDWTLTVTGNPAHSSLIFTDGTGSGAIYNASRILYGFHEALSGEDNLSLNPGIIAGGGNVKFDSTENSITVKGKSNIVAGSAMVRGDLRVLSAEQLLNAKKIMKEITTKNYPNTTATLEFGEGGYPAMSPSEGNSRLLKMYSDVSNDLGYGTITAVDPRYAGAADISFAADHVEMCLDAIGMPGSGGHTVNETANIKYLPVEAKRSAILIYRLSRIK